MAIETALTRRLRITHPIIQAPMAGGATTPALVAAASEAGALGFIGAAYLTPQQIAEATLEIRARTSKPFGINLFCALPVPALGNAGPALERMSLFHEEAGLPPPVAPKPVPEPFDEQLAAILKDPPPVFGFTFGLPQDAIKAVKARGIFVIGTATTVDEAVQLEAAGVDAVVAQGGEAGAHRGTFGFDFNTAMVGTLALVPQVVDAVKVPVIAAGGIMDGRGVAAALALGASAAQLGTAFLTCDESGTSEAHKKAILAAREHETRITRAFSGRPARGIVNRFMEEMERGDSSPAILPYPLQNTLTRPLRTAAAKAGKAEYLSLWAGQGVRMARRQPAAKLVALLVQETDGVIGRLHRNREIGRS